MSDPTPDPAPDARDPETPPPEAAPSRVRPASGPRFFAGLALLTAIAALALAAWQWRDSRGQLDTLRQALAQKLAEVETQNRDSQLIAKQGRDAGDEARVKIGVLENKLADSQNQQVALEALYQELSRNRDEWTFAEIEQSLQLASQQLQLAGNVKAALIALANAETRLQRMDRPQLAPLRKAVNRDVERLKALPYVDAAGISAHIDRLITAVDNLPLAMEARPAPAPVSTAEADNNPWMRFWHEAWGEIRQMVRIQRMDEPDGPLLAPSQSFFLRENLKLRLIGARLALLSRDQTSYRADLRAAGDWIARYYDTNDKSVDTTLKTVSNLRDSDITIETPDISGTLEALRGYREAARERPAR
jgi:uroporphyrin-3 C-methyltransferase